MKVLIDTMGTIIAGPAKLIMNAVKALSQSAVDFLKKGGLFEKIADVFKFAQSGGGWMALAAMFRDKLQSVVKDLVKFMGNLLMPGLMEFLTTIADKVGQA